MGRHIRASFAAVALSSLFVGCLAFDSLTGGGDDTDASPANDSGADSSTTDTSVADSGATDTSTSTNGFCSKLTDATFCDDFDEDSGLSKWQPPNVSSDGVLSVTATGLSLPGALVGEVLGTDASLGGIAANVSYIVPGTTNSLRYEYDLFVEKYDKVTGSAAYVNPFDNRVGLVDTELRIYLESDGFGLAAAITESDGGTTYPLLGAKALLTTGVWHHVDIYVDYTQNPAGVTFLFDSALVVSDAGVPGAIYGPGNVTVEGAMQYARTPTTGWKIRVDNVAVFKN